MFVIVEKLLQNKTFIKNSALYPVNVQPFFHSLSLRNRRFGRLKQAEVTIKIPIKKTALQKRKAEFKQNETRKKLTAKHYFNDVADKA